MINRRRQSTAELYEQRLRSRERGEHLDKMRSADDRLEEQMKRLESARRLYEERRKG